MQDRSRSCIAGSGAGFTPTACNLSDAGASFASAKGTSFWALACAFHFSASAGIGALPWEQSEEPLGFSSIAE